MKKIIILMTVMLLAVGCTESLKSGTVVKKFHTETYNQYNSSLEMNMTHYRTIPENWSVRVEGKVRYTRGKREGKYKVTQRTITVSEYRYNHLQYGDVILIN